MTLTSFRTDSALEVLAASLVTHADREGPLLPILHDLQAALGQIPAEVLKPLAAALQMTEAEVWGVVSFYHDFRREPAGDRVVKLCRAEACQARGGEELAADLLDKAGISWGGTTSDGRLTIDPVYCLGLCACGPAALVDGRPVARLTSSSLQKLAGVA